MNVRFLLLFCLISSAPAADVQPETTAAFDRYVKLTEQALEKRTLRDFLWLDVHPKEKSLVWLGQSVMEPLKTVDGGREIEVPGGFIQDWLGVALLEGVTLERVRDFLLNYADYRIYFKQSFIESRLVKRDGDNFDAFLRLSRKQFGAVILNMNVSARYVPLDPTHAYIVCHSTHIGEVEHPKQKSTYEQERLPAEASGYLWRHNLYWRLEQTGDGVYTELEAITLSRAAGVLSPSRFLNGFVQNFPREFVEESMEALQQAFPRPR